MAYVIENAQEPYDRGEQGFVTREDAEVAMRWYQTFVDPTVEGNVVEDASAAVGSNAGELVEGFKQDLARLSN